MPNPGVTLEVEPVVDDKGSVIDLNIAVNHIELLGFEHFLLLGKLPGGRIKLPGFDHFAPLPGEASRVKVSPDSLQPVVSGL